MEFGRRVGRNIIKPVRIAVRPAYRSEWDDAMALAWRTFMQFEACDCTLEGIESWVRTSFLGRMTTAGWWG